MCDLRRRNPLWANQYIYAYYIHVYLCVYMRLLSLAENLFCNIEFVSTGCFAVYAKRIKPSDGENDATLIQWIGGMCPDDSR